MVVHANRRAEPPITSRSGSSEIIRTRFGDRGRRWLEGAGDKLFAEKPVESIRTSNAIKRLHEEFKRRIKT